MLENFVAGVFLYQNITLFVLFFTWCLLSSTDERLETPRVRYGESEQMEAKSQNTISPFTDLMHLAC